MRRPLIIAYYVANGACLLAVLAMLSESLLCITYPAEGSGHLT